LKEGNNGLVEHELDVPNTIFNEDISHLRVMHRYGGKLMLGSPFFQDFTFVLVHQSGIIQDGILRCIDGYRKHRFMELKEVVSYNEARLFFFVVPISIFPHLHPSHSYYI
jgi:hypothetical protein